jgi:mRNA-degrading endonuclease toxin of MazEF toxin-antitoxin module
VTGSSLQPSNAGGYDGFVTKINAAGTAIVWSTFFGGSGTDDATGIALDGSGNVFINGNTDSTTFPGVTGSSLQPTNAGNGDTYLAKLDNSGSSILWSTFIGGNDIDYTHFGGLTVDSSGNPYVAGLTMSTTFLGIDGTSIQPSNAGGFDGFVMKVNGAGTAISWATFLGGAGDDIPDEIALDASGNVYVAGWTNSTSFPGVTGASIQSTYGGGDDDAFLTKFGTPGTPTISSISPTTGRAGDTITILGDGFGAPQGSGNVWLGSKYGNVVSWANTQVVATIASGATSGVAQVLQSSVWSNQISLTVITPNITSISPTSGVAGTSVTINGTGFGASQGSGNVWLGSKYGTVVSWSDTQVVATIASGATSGIAQILQGGVWSNQISLTVITPNITSISPTTAYSGDQITITGTGFGASQGSGNVWLGSTYGTVVSWSDTQVVTAVASGATSGVAQVYQGGVWSNQISLTVVTPHITSISPTNGPVGTQVTITGTGFRSAQGSGAVWLGSKYGTVVSWSDTQIVASVASGATSGVAQVYQGGVWSNQISFSVP